MNTTESATPDARLRRTRKRPESRPEPPRGALTYTINDASRVSGLSRATIYRRADEGLLRLVRVGGRTLVDAASLRALLGVAP